MIGIKPRRFWKQALVVAGPDGYGIELDGRPVRTPSKALLAVPSAALAAGIAAEWDAQETHVEPGTMPLTRAANSAIEKVTPQHDAVAAMIAAYGETDLLCYRAAGPEGLVERQAMAWDRWLAWAAEALAAPLTTVEGVMHAAQPEASVARLRDLVAAESAFALTGLHDLVMLSGSLVLGQAVRRGALSAEEAWELSRIDETWQEELWGRDAEAAQAAGEKRAAFVQAQRFLTLLETAD